MERKFSAFRLRAFRGYLHSAGRASAVVHADVTVDNLSFDIEGATKIEIPWSSITGIDCQFLRASSQAAASGTHVAPLVAVVVEALSEPTTAVPTCGVVLLRFVASAVDLDRAEFWPHVHAICRHGGADWQLPEWLPLICWLPVLARAYTPVRRRQLQAWIPLLSTLWALGAFLAAAKSAYDAFPVLQDTLNGWLSDMAALAGPFATRVALWTTNLSLVALAILNPIIPPLQRLSGPGVRLCGRLVRLFSRLLIPLGSAIYRITSPLSSRCFAAWKLGVRLARGPWPRVAPCAAVLSRWLGHIWAPCAWLVRTCRALVAHRLARGATLALGTVGGQARVPGASLVPSAVTEAAKRQVHLLACAITAATTTKSLVVGDMHELRRSPPDTSSKQPLPSADLPRRRRRGSNA